MMNLVVPAIATLTSVCLYAIHADAQTVGGALYAPRSLNTCSRMWTSVDFNKHAGVVDYTEDVAEPDWLPSTYMDGFHGDPSTKGSTNERAFIRSDPDVGTALEVVLPKGCVTSSCAFQTKSLLPVPLESATLSYKVKFGPKFDWVRGGKLPGLCGAACLTGCKDVSGLDGWSARNMWRPCVWPPVHPSKALKCTGGKLSAYVYHMFKEHWCGDDFDMENAMYARSDSVGTEYDFFQPVPDKWYTIQTHVRMNSAGDPGLPVAYATDGVLRTWLDGALVVDKTEMAWRQFNNVTIDTVYFSVFFGGSNPTFEARKDETIRFADFKVFEGECRPGQSPATLGVSRIDPKWDTMRPPITTDLVTKITVTKPYVGGGCGEIVIANVAGKGCDLWQLEISIRPSWGTLTKWSGLVLIDDDRRAGWYSLGPDTALVTDTKLKAGAKVRRARVCIMTTVKAKYLPDQFEQHVLTNAYCVKRGSINVTPENAPVVTPGELPRPDVSSNPDGGEGEDTLPDDKLDSNTGCKGTAIAVKSTVRKFVSKYCIDTAFTYQGKDRCTAFKAVVTTNARGSAVTEFKSTRMIAVKDGVSGGVVLKSPVWFKGFTCGQTHLSSTCFSIDGTAESPVQQIVATCTSREALDVANSGIPETDTL